MLKKAKQYHNQENLLATIAVLKRKVEELERRIVSLEDRDLNIEIRTLPSDTPTKIKEFNELMLRQNAESFEMME